MVLQAQAGHGIQPPGYLHQKPSEMAMGELVTSEVGHREAWHALPSQEQPPKHVMSGIVPREGQIGKKEEQEWRREAAVVLAVSKEADPWHTAGLVIAVVVLAIHVHGAPAPAWQPRASNTMQKYCVRSVRSWLHSPVISHTYLVVVEVVVLDSVIQCRDARLLHVNLKFGFPCRLTFLLLRLPLLDVD